MLNIEHFLKMTHSAFESWNDENQLLGTVGLFKWSCVLTYTLFVYKKCHETQMTPSRAFLFFSFTIIHVALLATTTYYDVTVWTVFFAIVCLSLAVYCIPLKNLPVKDKAILITGCDRGIGHALAKRLDGQGFHVFAACLEVNGEGSRDLKETCSSRLQTVQLDVSSLDQVAEALQTVESKLQEQGLQMWGVINNAGICYIGNVEMMTETDIQRIISVNFMGPINVCKKFLPLLRRSKGRIVNVASNAGLVPVPLMGIYCASKSALATISEVWRYEFKMWGIKVATIIPSGYKTGIMSYDFRETGDRWWSHASETVKQDYGQDCFYVQFKQKNRERFLSAEFSEICGNIQNALLSPRPKSYYYSGFLAQSLPFIYLHLPTCLSDPLMNVLTNWFVFKPKMLNN